MKKMMNKPFFDIAVVLINYNNVGDTKECVQSIVRSEGNLPFVLVVDNASMDGPTLRDHLSFYPYLECLLNKENLGFGRANNLAIDWVNDHLNTRYTFILNNDTIVEPGTLIKLQGALESESDPAVAVATPLINWYSDRIKIWYAGGNINFNKMVPDVHLDKALHGKYTGFASGCAMFFKTDVLKKMKGFDPFYFMYDEDVELSIALVNNGYKILFVPAAVIYHKCQGSQVKDGVVPSNQLHPHHPGLLFYLKNTIPNRLHTINKHLTGFRRVQAMLFLHTYWLLKSLQFALYGNRKAFATTLKSLTSVKVKRPNF